MIKSSWIAGITIVLTFISLNWSSFCHPSPENIAIKDQIRTVQQHKSSSSESTEPSSNYNFSEDTKYEELTWKSLTDVEFKDVYVEELDAYYWKPIFGDNVKAAEGKSWYITGYVIPVDIDEDFYVLSRYPFANCFFCGGAGPESVVDLQFEDKSPREYATDERLTFAGNLKLNADDVYQMNYIIIDAHEFTP